jgi:hypothetical protein
MNWLRNLAVLAVALVLTNSADAAKAKKKLKPVKGTVVEVKKDADKDSGSIVVKIAANKKKNTPESEQTIKVSTATTFEKVAKKVKGAPAAPATSVKFGEVQKDDRVVVTLKDQGEASDVKILGKAKAKKKKAVK